MIGAFGSAVFSTSDRRILTFQGLSRTTAARYAEHEILHSKPKTEYIGAGLDELSFTILLRADMGIDVEKELSRWQLMAQTGEAHVLVIGMRRIGSDLWVVSSFTETWNVLTNRGRITSATMGITLKEYMSR